MKYKAQKTLQILKNIRKYRKKVVPLVLGIIVILTPIAYLSLKNTQQVQASWWDGDGTSVWAKRKQLTLTNESTENLAANTTVAVTVDTSALTSGGKLQDDCDDLRVVYDDGSTQTELTRHLVYESETTCSTSKATKVYFPLQAALNTGSANSDNDYYMYYKNPTISAPSTTVDSFDVGAKNALIVCPFNGTSECINGDGAESPTTKTGAIRYGGAKTAMEFSGSDPGDDYVNLGSAASLADVFDGGATVEMWVYLHTDGDGSVSGKLINKESYRMAANEASQYLEWRYTFDTNIGKWRTPNGSFTFNSWNHIAVYYDSSSDQNTPIMYINGVSQSLSEIDTPEGTRVSDSADNLCIGGNCGGNAPMDGVIDEVRISNVNRYASNFSPPLAPFTRDEYTVILLHLDENGDDPRNTGKAYDDSDNGNHGTIVGAQYVEGLVGVNNGTSDTGNVSGPNSFAGHEGIFIEEGTTNKITNPSFEYSGDYDNSWDAVGADLTVSENTLAPYYKFGSTSAKIVSAGTDNDITITIDPDSTATHTLSTYVYNGTSGDIGGTVDNTVAQLVFESTAQPGATYTDAGGGWWRIDYSAATTDSNNEYGLEVADTKTVYIDGVQLEEKGYATTYADGSLGTGYSWSGTANESTSSRTAEDTRYSTTNNISGSAGTISMWVKTNWDGTSSTGGGRYFFSVYENSNTYLHLRTHASNGTLQLVIRAGGGTVATGYNTSFGYGGGSWKHVVATWSSGNANVYVNGSVGTTGTYTNTPDFSSLTEFIGQDNSNSNTANSSISNLQIFDTALTAAEITDLYQAGLVASSQGIEVDAFSDTKGQDPIAIYHFDESYGTTASDASQYGNHLTLSGASWETMSVGGRSQLERVLSFDGTDDYLTRSADSDFNFGTGGFSISGWFRHASSISGTDTILARYDDAGYKVYMDSSGYICFGIDDDATSFPEDTACTTTSYADSKWHHFEAVKDGTTSITLYIDGLQANQNSSTTADSTLNDNTDLWIGIDTDGSSNPWDGDLDEIIIYPYARTATQIKTDVLGGQRAVVLGQSTEDWLSDGLVGYWKMDENSGTNAADSSGNSNSGTLTNAQETGTGETASTTTTLVDADNANLSSTNDIYNGMILYITDREACDDASNMSTAHTDREIIDYDGSSKTFTVGLAGNIEYDGCPFEVRHQALGKFGKGMSFDGVDDYVDFGASTTLDTDTVTISAWINRSTAASRRYPIWGGFGGGGSRHYLFVNGNSGKFQFDEYHATNNDSGLISNSTNSTGVWQHITAVYENGFRAIYIDGSLDVSEITLERYRDSTPTNWVIGGAPGFNAASDFEGPIDEVRIYNRALSPAEVQKLYNWAPGPITYFDFEEGSGTTTFDRSEYGVNGTIVNSPNYTSGKFGKGLDLETDNDQYVTWDADGIDVYTTMERGVTASIWFKKEGTGGQGQYIFSSPSGGLYLILSGDNIRTNIKLPSAVFNTCTSTGDLVPANEWHHLSTTYDNTILKLYIDGIERCTDNTNSGRTNSNSNWAVGWRMSAGDKVDGVVDEFKIYNYARTPAQIIEDMNAGHPAPGSPVGSTVGHWKFDEGYGTTAYDSNTSTGGAEDLTLSTATSSWTNSGKFEKAFSAGGARWLTRTDDADLDFTAAEDMTISLWMNSTIASGGNPSTTEYIVNKPPSGATNGGYAIYANTSGQICFGIDDDNTSFPEDSVCTSTDVYDNAWHNIIAVKSGTNSLTVYLDGVVDGTPDTSISSTTNTLANSSTFFVASEDAVDDTDDFNGNIDDLKVYRLALTADQVKTEYNQGKSAVFGATSSNTSGVGSYDSASAYCPPGSTDTCVPPVGEWNFNEKNGQYTNDTSGNGNQGTLGANNSPASDDPNWQHAGQCKDGACLDFDGGDDYVEISDDSNLELPNTYSLSAWIKPESLSGWQTILQKGNISARYFLWLLDDEIGAAGHNTTPYTASTNANLQTNQWYHITFTFDSGASPQARIYKDGILLSANNTTGVGSTPDTGAISLFIGDSNDQTLLFNGQIDETRIYNYARTPAQIAWEYNRGGPVGWWKFDECQGSTAYDNSGNENNGTITPGAGTNTSVGTCSSGAGDEMWDNGTTGKRNASLDFDGSDDYVQIEDSTSLRPGNTVSLSTWIKWDGNSDENTLLAKQVGTSNANSYAIWIDSGGSGSLTTKVSNSTSDQTQLTVPSAVTATAWHHVSMTWDGTNLILYVDGKNVGSTTGTTTIAYDSNPLYVGVDENDGDDSPNALFFGGQIDEVKIFNYALTSQQIKTQFNEGAVKFD